MMKGKISLYQNECKGGVMRDLHLILIDPKRTLCKAFAQAFQGLPNVEIVHGYFEQLPVFDCMVSAANSFGLMDGGVDAAITDFFGIELMQRVQQRILDDYLGEQPIGTSLIVETGHHKHPFIAHTPTMRVPMSIADTDNVYTAMWAMLIAVRQHNRTADQHIRIIACPGLGTATGHVLFQEAARQMALAYRYFLDPPDAINWVYAGDRQAQISDKIKFDEY
jgi:O-acetyl-ADP-ribose deacetylase (regulator of RNase III)